MTTGWFLPSYIAAVLAGIAVLAVFRATAWYLHVTGAAVGVVAGLMTPVGASEDIFYLIAGTTFFFFTTWGVGGLILRLHRRGSRRARSERRLSARKTAHVFRGLAGMEMSPPHKERML